MKKLSFKKGSWILVPVLLLSFFSNPVKAQAQPGLSATVYNNYGYNNAPPLPTVSGRPVQCTTTYLSINQNFGNNICGLYDDFIVKYEGYITSPTTETYTLYMHGDDGVKLYLDDVLAVNAWYDSGNAGATAQVSFVAGVPQSLLAWYYENGGGNWVKLDYLVNGSWVPVPDSWFTQTNEPTNSTTTTTTLAPYFNAVENLTAIANEDGSVNLAWDAPVASNTEIYGYSINFVDYDDNVERGGWGVWTLAANTSYSLGHWMFDGSNPVTTGYGQVRFKVYAMNGPCAGVGNGSCLYGPITNVDATVLDPTPPTTTTIPPTTTTTTLPLTQGSNGCGPYRAFAVTGTTGGTIWGSGPYTDDSAFAAAAVHAGLIQVGQTAVIEPYAIDNYPWYDASYANGVYTNDWHSSWCGYQIKLLGTATPSTTTTTSSTSTTTTSTTTTTTTEPEFETTTTTEPVTTTTEPVTTTTEPATTDTTEPEVIEVPTATTTTEVEAVETTVPEEEVVAVEPPKDSDPTPEVVVPEDTQDAANAAVENIFDSPISDAKLADAVDDLVADAETPEQLTAVVTALLDQDLTDTQFATVIDSVFSEPLSDENFAAAVDAVFADPTKLSDAQFEDAVTAVFDAPLSDEQFQDAVAAVFEDTESLSDEQFDAAVQAVFDEPLSTEQFAEALSAVFDEPISDEKFDAIIGAVLDGPISDEQFEELVGVLESDNVTEEQVSAAVDSVIENGVTEDQSVDLATSPKVLESINTDQASEIFDAIPVSNLTQEEEAALVESVTNAPDNIKNSFQETIDIFGEGLDDYVPTGSGVDVKTRRALIAVVTATATLVGAPVPSGGGSGPSSNGPTGGDPPSGNEGGSNDRTTRRSRRK